MNMASIEGYGGRVGGTQFDDKVINGVRSDEVQKRVEIRLNTEKAEERLEALRLRREYIEELVILNELSDD